MQDKFDLITISFKRVFALCATVMQKLEISVLETESSGFHCQSSFFVVLCILCIIFFGHFVDFYGSESPLFADMPNIYTESLHFTNSAATFFV